MYYIYSINLDSLNIIVYEELENNKDKNNMKRIEYHAKNYIKIKAGIERSENAFFDNIKNEDLNIHGYFLRHTNNGIDLFYRDFEIIKGKIWNSYEYKVKKLNSFNISKKNKYYNFKNSKNKEEINKINLSNQKTYFSKIKPGIKYNNCQKKENQNETNLNNDFLTELKLKLKLKENNI